MKSDVFLKNSTYIIPYMGWCSGNGVGHATKLSYNRSG